MNSGARTLAVAVAWAVLTAGLLALIRWDHSDVRSIYAVLAGMSAMGCVSVLTRYLEIPPPTTRLPFNEEFLVTTIRREVLEKIPAPFKVVETRVNRDISPDQFIGVDNALALAKIRIDLERELRGLAETHAVQLPSRAIGISLIASELSRAEVLPESLLYPLREVVSVCNQAIHGYRISDEQTSKVFAVGESLIQALRALATQGPRVG